MHIPSASALLHAFARISQFTDVRPPPSVQPASDPQGPMQSMADRPATRQAVLPPEESEAGQGFRRPPPDAPIRRGMLVDLSV
jgi:hypothetical protein